MHVVAHEQQIIERRLEIVGAFGELGHHHGRQFTTIAEFVRINVTIVQIYDLTERFGRPNVVLDRMYGVDERLVLVGVHIGEIVYLGHVRGPKSQPYQP